MTNNSDLSSFLGVGFGTPDESLDDLDKRVQWGIDHIGGVHRQRAAQIVEEQSKFGNKTWGDVKRAILDDTALPSAAIRERIGKP